MKRLNKTQLAAELELNRATVKAHLRKPNAPKPDKAGLYDLAEVAAFVESEQANDDNVQSPELLKQRIEKLRLQNSLLRKQLAEQGDSVALNQIEPFLAAFLEEVRYSYISLSNALPPALVGKTDMEMLPILRAFHFRRLCDYARFLAGHNIEVQVSDGVKRVPWPVKSLAPGMPPPDSDPVSSIEDDVASAFTAIREGFLALGATVGAPCVGKSAPEIETIITAAVKARLRDISEQLRKITQDEAGKQKKTAPDTRRKGKG
jgi:hypothetical protein